MKDGEQGRQLARLLRHRPSPAALTGPPAAHVSSISSGRASTLQRDVSNRIQRQPPDSPFPERHDEPPLGQRRPGLTTPLPYVEGREAAARGRLGGPPMFDMDLSLWSPAQDPSEERGTSADRLGAWEKSDFHFFLGRGFTTGSRDVGGRPQSWVNSVTFRTVEPRFRLRIARDLFENEMNTLPITERYHWSQAISLIREHSAEHFRRYRRTLRRMYWYVYNQLAVLPTRRRPIAVPESELRAYADRKLRYLSARVHHALWETTCAWERIDYPRLRTRNRLLQLRVQCDPPPRVPVVPGVPQGIRVSGPVVIPSAGGVSAFARLGSAPPVAGVQRQVGTLGPFSTPERRGMPRACVEEERIPNTRSGILFPWGSVGERFTVYIRWRDTPGAHAGQSYCAARCGEYRQYIKGHMIANGRRVRHRLYGGAYLSDDQFHEDGSHRNRLARYGHRDEARTLNERFDPDRENGDQYEAADFPKLMMGSEADIDLTFKGQSYDKCNHTFGPAHTWRIRYVGPVRPQRRR